MSKVSEQFDIDLGTDGLIRNATLRGVSVKAERGDQVQGCVFFGPIRSLEAALSQGEAEAFDLDRYDTGLIGDGGGGNVEWWQDYIRAELERAHEFYQDQVAAQPAPQSEPAALAATGKQSGSERDLLAGIPAPWRAHGAAIDSKALATATEIALMWGQDHSQFVSRIQVAVIDAMRWMADGQAATASRETVSNQGSGNSGVLREMVGVEPVAVVGSDFTICWVGSGPIAPLVERHGIKKGSPLYADPPAQQPSIQEGWALVDLAEYTVLPQIPTTAMMDAGWPVGEQITDQFDVKGAYADLIAEHDAKGEGIIHGPSQQHAQGVDLGQFRRPIEEWRDDMEKWMDVHGDFQGAFAKDIAEADRLLALIDQRDGEGK